MKTLKDLQCKQDKLTQKLSQINDQIKEVTKDTLVQCIDNNYGSGCGMGHKIRDLEYLQTHWYEGPHGCIGGDVWHQGEGNFICSHCSHRNRLYNRPEIEELKYLFRCIKDEYDD